MKCFVIMPFEKRFYDVYTQIKLTVESSLSDRQVRCFRQDESRPSGRITEHLQNELNTATLCIADVTGTNPNVMWEVGYAMALGKPTILISQDVSSVPFDIRDMQTVEYDRDHLTESLAPQLGKVVLDTLRHYESVGASSQVGREDQGVQLAQQIEQLKGMVASLSELVRPQPASDPDASARANLPELEGHWIIQDSRSHLHARAIDGQLLAPYCYGGNDKLTAVFFDWRRAKEYWFARFAWFDGDIAGFTLMKQESPTLFNGAWWGDESAGADVVRALGQPPERTGEPLRVSRASKQHTPIWANHFFAEVQRIGLVKLFAATSEATRLRNLTFRAR